VPAIEVFAAGRAAIDSSAETRDAIASGQRFDRAKEWRTVQQEFRGEICGAVNRTQLDACLSIDDTVIRLAQFALDQIKKRRIGKFRK
jgi:hypothetical protein